MLRPVARRLTIAGIVLLGCTDLPQARGVSLPAEAQRPDLPLVGSRVTVLVPREDAVLEVDGKPVEGAGPSRPFETSPAPPGTSARVTVTVTWQANAYTRMSRSSTVTVRAGAPVVVDLRGETATDRVFVDYVPTSEDIVAAMVSLVGLTAADVVYEPGCGDARITIAAVKAGAGRGVGIDIDEERVAESRANVKAAGLDDRIEIRLGDALDISDLSNATVVFLFMGEQFNERMRPLLWKALPVGARVLSYRFGMGNWTPDKTVHVGGGEAWDRRLHLWTITEDVKRKGLE